MSEGRLERKWQRPEKTTIPIKKIHPKNNSSINYSDNLERRVVACALCTGIISVNPHVYHRTQCFVFEKNKNVCKLNSQHRITTILFIEFKFYPFSVASVAASHNRVRLLYRSQWNSYIITSRELSVSGVLLEVKFLVNPECDMSHVT